MDTKKVMEIMDGKDNKDDVSNKNIAKNELEKS